MKRTLKITISRKDLYAEKYEKLSYQEVEKSPGNADFNKQINQAIIRLITKIKEADNE